MNNNDYELVLKIKNAPMLNIMRLQGYNTAAELSRASGKSQALIGEMLNLKSSAYNKHGRVRPPVLDIADFLKVHFEMLYPEKHLRDSLKQNTMTAQVSGETMQLITSDSSVLDPSLLLENNLGEGSIDAMLEGLYEREAAIIKYRFEDELTLQECADIYGVNRERIRQIEAKALRKLRHPLRKVNVVESSGVDNEQLMEHAIDVEEDYKSRLKKGIISTRIINYRSNND